MPNWTFCTLHCDDATEENQFWEELKRFLAGDDSDGKYQVLTFNVLIPMPQYIYRGYLDMEEEARYGKELCWYQWSCRNWGVKWDASSVEWDGDCFRFDTPWSAPEPWFVELCRVAAIAGITGLRLVCHYEDGGCSEYTQQDDGSVFCEEIEDEEEEEVE